MDIFFECDSDKIMIKTCSNFEEAIDFIKYDMIDFCNKQDPPLEVPTKNVGITYGCWDRKFTIIYKVGCYAWSIVPY
jgi:hypothetical protein